MKLISALKLINDNKIIGITRNNDIISIFLNSKRSLFLTNELLNNKIYSIKKNGEMILISISKEEYDIKVEKEDKCCGNETNR